MTCWTNWIFVCFLRKRKKRKKKKDHQSQNVPVWIQYLETINVHVILHVSRCSKSQLCSDRWIPRASLLWQTCVRHLQEGVERKREKEMLCFLLWRLLTWQQLVMPPQRHHLIDVCWLAHFTVFLLLKMMKHVDFFYTNSKITITNRYRY